MAEINNADRILTLLRLQLERLKEAKPKSSSVNAPEPAPEPSAAPLERLSKLAGAHSLPTDALSHELIAALLAQEFGAEIANDAKFRQLVSDVMAAIERDPESQALLVQALKKLRSGRD